MVNIACGVNSSIMIAAKHNELNGFLIRSKNVAAKSSVAIITALTTEGDNPVMIAKSQSITIVITILVPYIPAIFSGISIMNITHDIIPT